MSPADLAQLQDEAAAAQAEYIEVRTRCNEEIARASARADTAFFRLQRAKEALARQAKEALEKEPA